MEVFTVCDCDNLTSSYTASLLQAKPNRSYKSQSVNGPWKVTPENKGGKDVK